jgi:hypothetical protein
MCTLIALQGCKGQPNKKPLGKLRDEPKVLPKGITFGLLNLRVASFVPTLSPDTYDFGTLRRTVSI